VSELRDPEESTPADRTAGERNALVESHLHVAETYVRRYRRRGVPEDDLRQVAGLALVHAADRFDPDGGASFSTFAGRTVDGELKRYFRDRTWSVRPPRGVQESHLALRRAREDLTQTLGRAPTVDELAERVGITQDEALEALEASASYSADSLDRPVDVGDGGGATVADLRVSSTEGGYADTEDRLMVERLMEGLPDRDRRVIELRFFEGRTQDEIATELGVSQSYLSRLLRRILRDMRQRARSG
jgi:RNA polymerase sigma-B factor